jgi:hypothetical protein
LVPEVNLAFARSEWLSAADESRIARKPCW